MSAQTERVAAYLGGVSVFAEHMSTAFADTKDALEKQNSICRNYTSTIGFKVNDVMSQLKNILHETEGFADLFEINHEELAVSNRTRNVSINNHVKNISEGLTSLHTVATESEDMAEGLMNTHIARMENEYAKAKETHYSLYEKTKNAKNAIVSAVPSFIGGWDKAKEQMVESCNTYESEMKELAASTSTDINNLQTAQDTQLTKLTEMVDTTSKTVDATLDESRNEFAEHCVGVSQWLDDFHGSLKQMNGQSNEFWESTYLLDLPSGMTPQRKIYDYPNQLTRTSPYERILSRFRASRIDPVAMSQDLDSVPEGSVRSSVSSCDDAVDLESLAESEARNENSPPSSDVELVRKASSESLKEIENRPTKRNKKVESSKTTDSNVVSIFFNVMHGHVSGSMKTVFYLSKTK